MGRISQGEQHCGNCRYWKMIAELENGGGVVGLCRRSAPGVALHSEHSVSFPMLAVWPVTTIGKDWCGEWSQF